MTDHLRIVLAHSSEDRQAVRALYHELNARGFSLFLDEKDLFPDQNWENELPKAIKSTAVVLACLSTNTVAKQSYAQKEFWYPLSNLIQATKNFIYLIPVRLDNCEIPRLPLEELGLKFASHHWVDLFDEGSFDRLAQVIDRVSKFRISAPAESTKTISPIMPGKAYASEASMLPTGSDRQVHRPGF